MVGIQGLGGIPEPKSDRPAKVRSDRENQGSTGVGGTASGPATKDAVKISSEAQAAAEISRLVQATQGEDVRLDRVEAARERLERGDYKNPDVVAQVAERLARYL